jgi:HlyD family secretion protein
MKKRALLIVILIATVTVSLAAYYRNASGANSPQFMTAAVSRGDVVDAVEATGALEAVTTVQVGTQVSGTIRNLFADYNAEVKKGQIVAELEPSLFQTQVDQASATLQRVAADYDRAKVTLDDAQVKLRRAHELWDKQLIPRTDLETADATANQAAASLKSAEAQVTQARASLRQAQVNLGHTIIRAPIDGIVISRSVDVGQTVAASMSAPTLFVIAQDLSRMRVNARIDESDIGRVAQRQPVTFKVDAYPGDTFTGVVSQVRLEPVTEQNVVSYVTIIDVPNPDLKLKPGMTASVTVEIARADGVLRVPNAALRFRAGRQGARVWIAGAEGEPRAVPVETGISDGVTTAVVGGALTERAEVITGIAGTPGAAAAASQAQQNGSPLIPRRPGGTRQQQRAGGVR